jgi:hypothetical protein
VDQQKKLQDVFAQADQRKAAAESKRIEESGGRIFIIMAHAKITDESKFWFSRLHFQPADDPNQIQLRGKLMIA